MIELMMVVVVAGIVLGFGLPAFRSYRLTLVKQQAREQLLQDLRGARQLAITQHTPVIVAFGDGVVTTNITTYTVHADRNNDRTLQSTESRKVKKLPRDTQLSSALSPVDSLMFDTSGILRLGTLGGRLVVQTTGGKVDTFMVSMAGIAYRP